MRDKPEKTYDNFRYPTIEYIKWRHDSAYEMLKSFMDRMGEELFVEHGIAIVNKYGRKHFKTKEDLLRFLECYPRLMQQYFMMHGKEIENERLIASNHPDSANI